MCRSIKTLRPPFADQVTDDDVRAAALQYVRKISGFRAPAARNAAAFDQAVEEIAAATARLLGALEVRPAIVAGGDRVMSVMRLILNLIWLILCGWWMAILYFLAGIICFILIITIPFGIASWRIASYVIWPFGRSIVIRRDAGIASVIGNIIWIILIGWWLAIGHLTSGIALCLTIIGIPLGLADFKMIPISLVPLGVRIVPSGELYPGYRE